MKTHPSYNSETRKHLETLNYFIKDIQENRTKNIENKFSVFLSKPSINSLSKFGCQYNDFRHGSGEIDEMLPHLLKAQMGLIEVCLKKILSKSLTGLQNTIHTITKMYTVQEEPVSISWSQMSW